MNIRLLHLLALRICTERVRLIKSEETTIKLFYYLCSTIASVNVKMFWQLDAEYRRFMLSGERLMTFTEFHQLLEDLHRLKDVPFTVWFTDNEGDLLPINNDDNFTRAVRTTKRLLRLTVLKSGMTECIFFLQKSVIALVSDDVFVMFAMNSKSRCQNFSLFD